MVSLQTVCTELKHANYIASFTRKFIQLDLSHFSHVHPYLTNLLVHTAFDAKLLHSRADLMREGSALNINGNFLLLLKPLL